jgi:predicted enzyme related to lactoylglutathione lyase
MFVEDRQRAKSFYEAAFDVEGVRDDNAMRSSSRTWSSTSW